MIMRFFSVVTLIGTVMQTVLAAPTPLADQNVPNKYIVILKDTIDATQFGIHKDWLFEAGRLGSNSTAAVAKRGDGAEVPYFPGYNKFRFEYSYTILNGYSAEITPEIAQSLEVSVHY
jgi:hypothetical protein